MQTYFKPYSEDGVRARGVRVHCGGRRDPVGNAHPQQVGALPDRLDVVHRQVWRES